MEEESWRRNHGGGIIEEESTLGFPPQSRRSVELFGIIQQTTHQPNNQTAHQMDSPQPNNPLIKLSNNPTPNTPMPEQSNNQQPSKPIRKQTKKLEQHLSSRQQNVKFGLHFPHICLQRLTLGGVREGPGTTLEPIGPHTPKNHKNYRKTSK